MQVKLLNILQHGSDVADSHVGIRMVQTEALILEAQI